MRCTDCGTQTDQASTRSRGTRRSRAARCAHCGARIPRTPLVIGADAGGGTLAHLARYGLAITGAPLLEPEPEASKRCAES